MFRNQIKVFLRYIIKKPFFTIINIGGLAIGISVALLIFMFIIDEYSYDKFHKDSERLYRIEQGFSEGSHWAASQGFILDQLIKMFPEVEGGCRFNRRLLPVSVQTEKLSAMQDEMYFADSSFFDIFGFKILEGDANKTLNTVGMAVVSEGFAQRFFDGNPIGQTFKYNNRNITVGAVMENSPPNSHFRTEVVSGLIMYREAGYRYNQPNAGAPMAFHTYIRLKEGVDGKTFSKKINEFAWEITAREEYREESNNTPELIVMPVEDIHLHSHAEKEIGSNSDIMYVRIFGIIAIFIILIACINYANLSTARTTIRGREAGIRRLLGAGPGRIFRQIYLESYIIAFIAMIIGLCLTELLTPAFNTIAGKEISLSVFSNPILIWISLAIFLLSGGLSGIYPAIVFSRIPVKQVLKMNKNGTTGRNKIFSFRRILVVFQFTISAFLIISTIAIHKQLNFIFSKDIGFTKENILVFRMPGPEMQADFENFKQEAKSLSEVKAVGFMGNIPGKRVPYLGIRIPNLTEQQRIDEEDNGERVMRVLSVDEEYLDLLEINTVQGEGFHPGSVYDRRSGFLLNQAAVEELQFEDAVGKAFEYTYGLEEPKSGTIIGVTEDFNYASLHHEVEPLMIHIFPDFYRYLCIRFKTNNLHNITDKLEKIWLKNIPSMNFEFEFLETSYNQNYRRESSMQVLSAIFGGLAIFIACMGLIGLASYMAEQRKKEVSIRKVLGAPGGKLLAILSKEYVVLIIIANIIAWLPAIFFIDNWQGNFAYEPEESLSPYILAAVITMGITLISTSIISIKTIRENPVNVLKYE